MANNYLTDEVQAFIVNHTKSDPYKLLLQKSPFPDVSMKFLVQQIQGRNTAASKFPFLLEHQSYNYPPKISLEQASSEQIARFKAGLIEGDSFADLTGGMGIDSYLLGNKFDSSYYVEPNQKLFDLTMSNFSALGYDQCSGSNQTAEEFLDQNQKKIDWIYIDPSRRIEGNRKTSITNYEPNIVELKDQMLSAGDKIMIKLSPMQDISECIAVLGNVERVWVISIKNDVKELLIQLGKNPNNNPELIAIDLLPERKLDFRAYYLDRLIAVEYSITQKYIYQPAASLVKSELHNKNAKEQGLRKLHPNTQLFTSDILMDDYFGRVFEVVSIVSSHKKELKIHLPKMKANVISKNYPLNPNQLISKLKIKEGGEDYILGYTDAENKKKLAVCKRLVR